MSSLSFLALRKKHEVVQSEKLLKLNPSADTNIIELTWMQKRKTIRVYIIHLVLEIGRAYVHVNKTTWLCI